MRRLGTQERNHRSQPGSTKILNSFTRIVINPMIRGRSTYRATCTLLAFILVCGAASAQTVTGRLLGAITDASGAAVPNVEVVATNRSTGIGTKTNTDTGGNYIFVSLPPGTYSVKAAITGFKTAVSENSPVSVAQTIRVDFTLQVGQVSESVEVTAKAPLVESTTSDVGQNIDQAQVQTMPINGRIFSQLVNLVPGAIPSGHGDAAESASGAGARSSIQSNVNGISFAGTTYTLDGVANAEPLNAFINIAPPVEAIEEFRVQTSNPSAEFGTFGGAIVNVTLRSGTNEFHGSLFEYLRNEQLNAKSFFAGSKAPWKTNQFGGTFGGPIKKNKAFIFGDYQALLLRNGVAYRINVPTADMLNGVLTKADGFDTIYDPDSAATSKTVLPFANNTIPRSRWDGVTSKVLGLWPKANISPTAPGPYGNYAENASNKQRMDAFDVKGDYHFERLGRLFVRESYVNRNLDTAMMGNPYMMVDPDSRSRNHNAVIGHSISFGEATLNELRLGFNRFDTSHYGQDYGTTTNNDLGIKNGNLAQFPESSGIAEFGLGLQATGAPGWTNGQRATTTYEITDGMSKIAGNHTLKFGADIRRLTATLTNPQGTSRGYFGFGREMTSQDNDGGAEFGSFLLGYPSDIYRSLVNTRPGVQTTQGGAYFQDDWRITRQLTINLGLRWDIFSTPHERHDRQVNFNPTTGKFNAATSSNRGPNVDTQYGNWAPRLGLAFSPDNGKTAFRAAGGLSYFSYNYGATGGTLERNFPLFQSFELLSSGPRPFSKVSVDGLPNFIPTALSAEIAPGEGIQPFFIPQNFRPAQIAMFNAGVQRQLDGSTSIDLSYVATRGTHLFRNRDINTVLSPGPGTYDPRRPYYRVSPGTPSIVQRGSDGKSSYNSFQAKVSRRFSSGFQALVSYTLADSYDNQSIFWVWDDKLNWGPTLYRQTLSVSWTWDLPFGKGQRWMSSAPKALDLIAGGWSINGVSWNRTGSQLSVGIKNNRLNTGTSNYANKTCGDLNYPKRLNQWFDTSCFSDPTDPYAFGNAVRGSVYGPGVINFDISASKRFKITARQHIEFRAEAFNATNTPHFSSPNTSSSSGSFGKITGTSQPPREMQLGLKYVF